MKTIFGLPFRINFLLVFTLSISLAAPAIPGWPPIGASGQVQAASVWTRTLKLFAADGTANAAFGSGVALSEDTLVVGAPDQGTSMRFFCRW